MGPVNKIIGIIGNICVRRPQHKIFPGSQWFSPQRHWFSIKIKRAKSLFLWLRISSSFLKTRNRHHSETSPNLSTKLQSDINPKLLVITNAMKHNGKAPVDISLRPIELKSRVWNMTLQIKRIQQMCNMYRWPHGGSQVPEMSYFKPENWWHHKNVNISRIGCTYFSRNSCRPCRRWSTWWGLFILKKGVLDGSSGNCLYKQEANPQLKPNLEQLRKMQ